MKKYMFLSAALLLLTASCSNDENNEQKGPTQAVQFSFTNEDFGEDEAVTRTNAAGAKPQIVDLGDCEAEITVESEPAVKTRGALSPANGHYTIRAYQTGTLKGEMKGTFSGGTFTPDGGSNKKLNLPYGTYDFVAFNDKVTISGTELKVNRTDVETARMGFATVTITGPTPIQVQFTMKHVGCRLRTQFVCQKHIPNNITATLEQTVANVIPTSVAYDPATKAYTSTNGAMTAEANNSPASAESEYYASNYGQNYVYTSTSNYHYFLPTTAASKLKLNFTGGTLFAESLNGNSIPKLNATLSMQANKSYVVKIKLKPTYIYLMSDGTTGHFKDTTFGGGTKTPIAVVVDKSKHLAVALKNASGWCDWTTNTNYFKKQVNVDMKKEFTDMLLLENGYEETWDGSYTTALVTGEKVKAKRADFPAFKACADYNSGVTITGANVGKWYLPAYGEWKYVFTNIGFGDISQILLNGSWYGHLAYRAFTQVGGMPLTDDSYWSSSEQDLDRIGYTRKANAGKFCPTLYFATFQSSAKGSSGGFVRPFVKY